MPVVIAVVMIVLGAAMLYIGVSGSQAKVWYLITGKSVTGSSAAKSTPKGTLV